MKILEVWGCCCTTDQRANAFQDSPRCSVPFCCHWQLASSQLRATHVCGNKTKVKTWSTWEKREKVSGKWAVATQRQGTLLRGLTRRRARWLSTSREARYQTKTNKDRTRSSSALCAVFRYQQFEIVQVTVRSNQKWTVTLLDKNKVEMKNARCSH